MNNFSSAIRLAKYACLMTFALFCIIMLAFSTIYFSGGSYLVKPDNGFIWLTFDSNMLSGRTWDVAKIPIGIISIGQLILGLVAVGTVAYNFVKKHDSSNKNIIIGGFASMTLYALEGIIVRAVYINEAGSFGSVVSDYLSTVSFIPLIIGVVTIVGYFVIDKYMPENSEINEDSIQTTASSTAKATPTISECERIESLTKYNDLLTKGIITQEEFDAKKKQLLGL